MVAQIALSVDALSPELTGVGRYCWELASRLPRHAGVDQVTFWRHFKQISDPADLLQADWREPPPQGTYWRRSLRRWGRKLGLVDSRADWPRLAETYLFHSPNFFLPPWVDRGVATIHDLSVLLHPDTHPPERVAAFEREFERTLAIANAFITPSRTVRDELILHCGVRPERVTAIPMGVGANFKGVSDEERSAVLRRLGLPESGYGLTISAIEPRKRIDRLIAAWGSLEPALRLNRPLVIAGAKGWNNAGLLRQIEDAARAGWVIPLGFVAEADLPALISGATLFAYPSRYEGFGLPPIEAMACGVPVLVANDSCLPEVTDGAAMLTEPEDPDAFAKDLERGLVDEAWRSQAVTRGLAVASRYTWEACLDQTVEVYSRCG